jgi:chromosome partitioning protein
MNNIPINPKMLASEAAEILDTSIQNVHKKLKQMNLKTNKAQNRIYFGHHVSRKLFNFSFNPKIYSFQLVKGGVGKTVISLMFSIKSALLGAKTLLIEIDQQSNLTRTFKIDASDKPVMIDIITQKIPIDETLLPIIDGLDFLPSRVDNALLDNTLLLGKYPLDKVFSSLLEPLKEKYNAIIIDCPPSIGAAVTSVALTSDIIILPVNPTDYSVAGLELTYRELMELVNTYGKNIEIKILFNKYDGRTTLSFNTLSQLIKQPLFGQKMIQTYIRTNQSIENCLQKGKTIFDTIRNTSEKEDFTAITKELLGV